MRRAILAGVVIAPFIAVAVWQWSAIAALAIVFVSQMLVLYPTLRPNVQWLGPVMTRFEPNGDEVWLTIDDGPTADTSDLLNAFDARGVKATFFVKGELAARSPEAIVEILRRGHSIGNHSYSHPSGSFWCLLPSRISDEIDRCNAAIEASAGGTPALFRAPVGMKNPAVHPALGARNMSLIGWTARAFDTQTSDPDLVLRRILPDVEPGAIILLHQGRQSSVPIIERVIDEVRRRGYAFVIPSADRLKTNR